MPDALLPAASDIVLPPLRVSACPHPFEQRRLDYVVPAGFTIAEIVELTQPDPLLRAHGDVFLGDHLIPRDRWHRVRPIAGTQLSIRLLPSGGGAGRIIAMIGIAVAALALVVATGGLGAPVLLGLSGAELGMIGAAAISIAGTLLVNTLLPPPLPERSKNRGDPQTYVLAGARNNADLWGKAPFLCGRHKIVPPYAAMPYREVIGTDIYWRAIFAIGHGPIALDQILIGETDIANFAEVDWEFRRGYWAMPNRGDWNAATAAFPPNPAFGDTWTCTAAGWAGGQSYAAGQTITFNGLAPAGSAGAWDLDQGKGFSLYPDDVNEESLAVALTYAGGPQVRTTVANADEAAVEVVFESLVHIENQPAGRKADNSVVLRIDQAPAGGVDWATVIQQTITGRQQTPLYWGYRWRTADVGPGDANGKYDIRISRLTRDFDEDRNFGKCSWSLLKTITTGNPVPVGGLAMMSMRIRATGQLQGTLDEVNVIARTIARDYDAASGTWVWRPTSQPAALVRHVLQHPARRKPAADSQIDLARLAWWDGVTRPANRVFNGVFDAKTSLWDALTRIARLGRAVMTLRDLKFSVVIDEPKGAPVRLFSPRNSWDYEGEMNVEPSPHGYRIGYVNSEENWKTDELVVYDDGYGPSNATLVDKVEVIGITTHDQAWREGRYHIAQQRLRREIHHSKTDFEHLACERGDLVALQHDVIAVGLASARIAARTETGSAVTDVTLDAAVTMQGGRFYGLRVRRVVGGAMQTDLYRVYSYPGTSPRLYLVTPPLIPDAPAVGDLVSFGIWDRETLRVLVRDIEPAENLSAKLTLIAEAPGVHVAEQGTIPPYDPMVTAPPSLPAPIVIAIASDERVMMVTPSRSLIERAIFSLQAIAIEGATLSVLYRLQGSNAAWQTATIQEETAASVAIIGLQSGETYDLRLQYQHPQYFSSAMTAVNAYYVIGRTSPPADLQNLSIAVVGGQALLRWDPAPDLDVQIGGWITFRHSPDMTATLWPNSTSIATAVVGDQTHVYMPLKPGTYFARVYDADGRPSNGIAHVSTRQANVLAFAPVGDVEEDPLFTGARTNCALVNGGLMLNAEDFDSIPDVDAEPSWDVSGGVAASGTYKFAAGIDLGSVTRARVTSHLLLEAVNEHDFWDAKIGLIDTWPDVDGTLGASIDASVWGKLTDGNPGSNPSWGAFTRIDSFEMNARAIGQMECRLSSADRAFNLWLTELRVDADGVA